MDSEKRREKGITCVTMSDEDLPVSHGWQIEVVEEQFHLLKVLLIDEAVDVVVAGDVDGVVVWIVRARHDSSRLAFAQNHLIALCTCADRCFRSIASHQSPAPSIMTNKSAGLRPVA